MFLLENTNKAQLFFTLQIWIKALSKSQTQINFYWALDTVYKPGDWIWGMLSISVKGYVHIWNFGSGAFLS